MTLRLAHASARLGGREVVRDLSISIDRGEIVGLLGPNGAGKTTTFNLITGQLRPSKGVVLLNGLDIVNASTVRRARLGIGYLPQEASIFRNLTVRQNLLLVMNYHRILGERQKKLLSSLIKEFNLESFIDRRGAQLSGGERRRAEVARALATSVKGPDYLLLDEPFAGVDPLSVHDLQQLILALKPRNIGILITDHNVRETLTITDHAYILTDGTLLATGTSDRITADPLVRQYYLGEKFSF
ncbi:MAG: LPS export ABC transporter ATP-binding protein [Aphanocapsa feldmannii 277cV]|uniref:LPS export ABC transporter ATP-binding protein n=2 Tax=Aphanocapsa feldmannii TaxID=192050 RepID=A0A524RL76_9CHRO|nr:MAG: LPS export ABC transporter ATP-binding protein [Aphanocapsa feldmannii 277cV]